MRAVKAASPDPSATTALPASTDDASAVSQPEESAGGKGAGRSLILRDAATSVVTIVPPRWHSWPFEPRTRKPGSGSLTRPFLPQHIVVDRHEVVDPTAIRAARSVDRLPNGSEFRKTANRLRCESAMDLVLLQSYVSRTPVVDLSALGTKKRSSVRDATRRQLLGRDLTMRDLHDRLDGSPERIKHCLRKVVRYLLDLNAAAIAAKESSANSTCAGCKGHCKRKSGSR
ncbi:hypothetical protein GCM10007320_35040 [Pseudorhodoferax aquiterrae]|uniref:DnaA-like protein n=2 Tax=Pseudorhodoferax aquiterrae TaxID=747304 RepID=A0ABQ3G4W7_9BURK|nr:hypothetical protein GCM10007320_35040 [Pseudorhodoferax aquiterrae]